MKSLAVFVAVAVLAMAPPDDPKFEGTASLYVRADTDKTTVVSPRARINTQVGDERSHLDLVYAIDVWTSASVDIRTAATEPVREQRDEVIAGVDRDWSWGTVALSYRLSHENDYVSNSGAVSVSADFLDHTVTLDARAYGGGDIVGRSGDVSFRRTIGYGGGFLSYSHVLSPTTVLVISAEVRGQQGYLASPYRWVSLGGGGRCADSIGLCVPEQHPGRRIRSAGVARLRQALSRRWSLGAAYRFYGDTWGVLGHTGLADVRVSATKALVLGLEARAYTQGAASFYSPQYDEETVSSWVTRDRELSSMFNARGGFLMSGRWELATKAWLIAGALVGAGHYHYRQFAGLTDVTAFEVTGTLGGAF